METCFKIGNRIGAVVRKEDKDVIDSDIVVGLLEMLGGFNRLGKVLKMARGRFGESFKNG